MKVSINGKEIIVFRGARIGDAVLSYSPPLYTMLLAGQVSVYDRFGNLVEPDGPLHEGQILTLKISEQP